MKTTNIRFGLQNKIMQIGLLCFLFIFFSAIKINASKHSDYSKWVKILSNIDRTGEFDCAESGHLLFTKYDKSATIYNSKKAFISFNRMATITPSGVNPTTVECDGTGNDDQLLAWVLGNGGLSDSDVSGATGDFTWMNNFTNTPEEMRPCDANTSSRYDVEFWVVDDIGESNHVTRRFRIRDFTPPILTVPGDIILECNEDNDAIISIWEESAYAIDECEGDIAVTFFKLNTVSCGSASVDSVFFSAIDRCGNETVDTAIITFVDRIAPEINCPQNLVLECSNASNDQLISDWLSTATAVDFCDVSNLVITNNYNANGFIDGCGLASSQLITFSVQDECVNINTCEASIAIVDNTPPTITAPANLTVECDGNGNLAELNGWLGVAISPPVIVVNGDFEAGNTGWGNSAEIMDDNVYGGAGGNIVAEVDGDASLQNTISGLVVGEIYTLCLDASRRSHVSVPDPVEANITLDGVLNATISRSGSFGYVQSCFAFQASAVSHDLSITANFVPTVGMIIDNVVVQSAGLSGNDSCSDEDLIFSNERLTINNLCGSTLQYTYRFTALDNCGNSSSAESSFTIDDTTPPVIDASGATTINVECDGASNAVELLSWLNNNGGLTATDACGEVNWSNDFGSIIFDCGTTGSATVVFTASDACGNASSAEVIFTINDATPPFWEIAPVDITLECTANTDPLEAISSWLSSAGGGTAKDSCSLVFYANDFSGLTGGCNVNTGFASVTFTATDVCGNSRDTIATVTVIDNEGPYIYTPPLDTIVECDGANNERDLSGWLSRNGGGVAFDICGSASWNTPQLISTNEGCGSTFTNVYMFQAIDECGNLSIQYNAKFTIQDTTPPMLTAMATDMTVECNGQGNLMELENWLSLNGMATASDICGPVTWEYDLISGGGLCDFTGAGTYRFTVKDECGNSSSTTAAWGIVDNTPPTIIGGNDMLMEECIDPPGGNYPEFDYWLESNAGATATDACTFISWSNDFNPANWVNMCGNAKYVDVTFTAQDFCGNRNSFTRRFGIGDVTAPYFINCPRPVITAAAPATWCEAFVNFDMPYALDRCGSVTITQIDNTGKESGDLFPVGITVLLWEARDLCGNADTCALKIVVNDYHTPPTISCPNDINLENDPGICAAIVLDSDSSNGTLAPEFDDNCIDHVAVLYEVIDATGATVAAGVENVSGELIPLGVNNVVYSAQDQPVLLITEVVQSASDSVEITNFGPASMNISCLNINRLGTGAEVHIVPIDTILKPGETYVAALANDIGFGDPAGYTISFKNTIFDVVATNNYLPSSGWVGNLEGGDVQRIWIVDHDNSTDWIVSQICETSIGELNQGLPAFNDNGAVTGIQTVLPSEAFCEFVITVIDTEAPLCKSSVDVTMAGTAPIIFNSLECTQSTLTINEDAEIAAILIEGLTISYADVSDLKVSLIGPDGTKVKLFEKLCEDEANVQVNLSDSSSLSIVGANCAPLGNGGWYSPEESLNAFCNKSSLGDWTLEVYSFGNEMGTLEGWNITIQTYATYAQKDTILEVQPILSYEDCGADFTWVHPIVKDNCCDGTITVEYISTNKDTVPEGGLVDAGTEASEFFGLGKTTVKYTITDLAGNSSTCSFDVIVTDPNGYCVPPCQTLCVISCVGHINVSLDENCEAEVTPSMTVAGVDSSCDYYYKVQLIDENGVLLPSNFVGIDYLGQTLTYKVIEPECGNACWGTAYIEDKIPPVIACNDVTISCLDLVVFPQPVVTENCSGYDLVLLNESTLDISCESEDYRAIITRTYQATDGNGQESNICEQKLTIKKFDLTDIKAPSPLDVTLECGSGYLEDEHGLPHPNVTGVPTLNGQSLWPNNLLICNTYVSYKDEVFSYGNDCQINIQRVWTISNWECGKDNVRTIGQFFRIFDRTAPEFECPSDLTMSAEGVNCEALVVIPALNILDACNRNNVTVNISYPGGIIENSNGGQIYLKSGVHEITYTVSDVCGNIATCSYSVTIIDSVDPSAICDAGINVSLSSDGRAQLMAADIDNGSFDACGAVDIDIRRMEPLQDFPNDINFSDKLNFGCSDVGNPVMVALRVTDEKGNSNQCMIAVQVIDLIPIALVAGLPDITVACTFPYDPENLDVFGTLVNDPDDRNEIVLTSQIVQFDGPALDGLVTDNCSTGTTNSIGNIQVNDCGIGYLIRVITAVSPSGEQVSTTQKITFVNPTPFKEEDIIWPENYSIYNSCNANDLIPENLPLIYSVPRYTEDVCDLVSYTFQDKTTQNTANGGGCVLVERTWFVSDWCQKIDGKYIVFDHKQTITIYNNIDPIITSACSDTLITSQDPNCGDVYVSLGATGEDDCVIASNLIWSYSIDINSDGNEDITGSSNAFGYYFGVGVHTVNWLLSDGCGNFDNCSQIFEIRNIKTATPICFNGLSTALIGVDTSGNGTVDGELATITPAFIDGGSYHTCGYDLQLSFSSDVNDTLRTFDCSDIGQQVVQLWVTDDFGNQDFCSTYVIVVDNNDVDICPNLSAVHTIQGSIYTESQIMIDEATVYLEGTDIANFTDANGHYDFPEMPLGGNYKVIPGKNTGMMNGVTTLDLVLIQNHILGKNILNSPYKLLAADINNSGNVSSADLIALRKMILGLMDEFPNNKSWRFIDASFQFIEENNPWSQSIAETFPIYNLNANMEIDFLGVKIGDVNGSVVMNGLSNSNNRSAELPLIFSYENRVLSKGQTIAIPFYADDINEIIGFQFTLNIDPNKAVIRKVVALNDGMTSNNFGLRYLDKGILTSSWNESDQSVHLKDKPMFEITIEALVNTEISDLLSINDKITYSEAYNKSEELLDIQFNERGISKIEEEVELFQNSPNPWTEETYISFRLPKEMKAKLIVYNLSGQLLLENEKTYSAGIHNFKLEKDLFNSGGIYYYELITEGSQLSKKMVLIK